MIVSGLPWSPWKMCLGASIDQCGGLQELKSNWAMSDAEAIAPPPDWMSTLM
jgi:hypothetical protein